MAYKLSLKDFDEEPSSKADSKISLKDFDAPSQKSQSSPSLGSQLEQSILNIGGGLSHGGLSSIASLLNIPHSIAPNTFGQVSTPNAPFADTSSPSYNVANVLGQYSAPAGVSGNIIGKVAPELGNVLHGVLTGALTGALGTDTDLTGRAGAGLVGGALGGALPVASKVVKGIGNLGNLLKGQIGSNVGNQTVLAGSINPKVYDQLGSDLYNHISHGGMDSNDLNKYISGGILKSYQKNKDMVQGQFKDLLKDAENRGYSPNVKYVDKEVGSKTKYKDSGILSESGEQFKTPYSVPSYKKVIEGGSHIQLSPKTQEMFKEVMESGKNIQYTNPSQDVIKTMINFSSSPSLRNAHELQSVLGQKGFELNKAFNLSPTDQDTAKLYNNLKDNIINDIGKTFSNNTDTDLFERYLNARENWKNEVVPYHEAQGINQLVLKNKGNAPVNILNSLSKENVQNENYDKIRSDLMQDPKMQSAILAKGISQGLEGAPSSQKMTKLSNILQGYDKMPDILKSMTNPAHRNAIDALRQMAQGSQDFKKSMRNATLVGGALTGTGIPLLHHVF